MKGQRGRRRRQLERWLAMKLAQELTGEMLAELARRFGVENYGTVSTTIVRLSALMTEDVEVEALYNSIRADLTP